MEIIIVIIILFIIAFLIIRKYKKDNIGEDKNYRLVNSDRKNNEMDKLLLQIETVNNLTEYDENKLMKITDNKVIKSIMHNIPNTIKAANSVKLANDLTKVTELYKVTLSSGGELAKVKGKENLVRAFSKSGSKIKEHAELKKFDIKNYATAANLNATMDIVSMIVGQYYLSEINNKMESINNKLDKVISFQENEYKSKVMALVVQIKSLSKYQLEILNNKECLTTEINNISRLEHECISLLGQSIESISSVSKKRNLDYKGYEENVKDVALWCLYQESLAKVLSSLAELKYTFYKGSMSMESCSSLSNQYYPSIEKSRVELNEWHNYYINKFKINIEECNQERQGLSKVIYYIPGKIDEKNNYKALDQNTMNNIINQKRMIEQFDYIYNKDLYNKDVNVLIKNNELYYIEN